MIDNFLVIFKVKISYILNSTLYYRKNSLLKRTVKKVDYNDKSEIYFYAFFQHVFKYLLMYIFCLLLFGVIPMSYISSINKQTVFTYFISLMFGISILYAPINNLTEDNVYSVEYLKIKYNNFYICEHLVKLFQLFCLMFLSIYSLKFLYDYTFLSLEDMLLLSYIYASYKNVSGIYNLNHLGCKKTKIFFLVIAALLSFVLLKFSLLLSMNDVYVYASILTLFNLLVFVKFFKYRYYDKVYKNLIDKYKRKSVKLKGYEVNRYNNEIMKNSFVKNNNPYKNFINLFNSRYKRSLPNSVSIISMLFVLLMLALSFLLFKYPDYKEFVGENIKYSLIFISFLLILINKSKTIMKQFYNKVDKFMLTNNFYKSKNISKKLYTMKLFYSIKKTIISSFLIGFSLSVLYYVSGTCDSIYEYFFIVISPVLFTILLSMYYCFIYYVFNPYKNNQDKINPKNLVLLYFPYYIVLNFLVYQISIITFSIVLLIFFVVSFILNLVFISNISNKLK